MISIINKLVNKVGYSLKKTSDEPMFPPDFNERHKNIIDKVRPYTMTSPERVAALVDAVDYICRHNIEGSIVECGVWKGGSMMATLLALNHHHANNRAVYLYDTFEGMPPAEEVDKNFKDQKAEVLLEAENYKKEQSVVWAYSSLEEVKSNIYSIAYPKEKIHFIKGKVEDTIPSTIPDKIALLRLDTDWYQSTKHELEYLYPLLMPGGVLIIDDYGFWKGARKAVDEYFVGSKQPYFLHRIDDTGRILIKQ